MKRKHFYPPPPPKNPTISGDTIMKSNITMESTGLCAPLIIVIVRRPNHHDSSGPKGHGFLRQQTGVRTAVEPCSTTRGEQIQNVPLLLPTSCHHAEHLLHEPAACRAIGPRRCSCATTRHGATCVRGRCPRSATQPRSTFPVDDFCPK